VFAWINDTGTLGGYGREIGGSFTISSEEKE
jgi:hypothetical protein